MACIDIPLSDMTLANITPHISTISSAFKIPQLPEMDDPEAFTNDNIQAAMLALVLKFLEMIIITPIKSIVDSVGGVITIIKSQFEQLISVEIPQLGVNFSDFLAEVSSDSEAALSSLVSSVRPIFTTINPIFLPNPLLPDQDHPSYETWEKVKAAIKESTLTIFKMSVDILLSVVQYLADLGAGLSGPIQDLVDMISGVGNLLSDGFGFLLGLAGVSIDDMKLVYENFKTSITSPFPIITVPEFELSIGDRVENFWKKFISTIQNWWMGFMQAIYQKFVEVVGVIIGILNSLSEPILETITQALSGFGGLVAALQAIVVAKVPMCSTEEV